MPRLVNIHGESGGSIFDDDTSAVLTLTGNSSGAGLSVDSGASGSGIGVNIDMTAGTGSGIDVYSDNTSYAARIRSNSAAAPALHLAHGAAVGSATIAPLGLVASTASQAFIQFEGILLSTASMSVLANQSAFHIPVYHKTNQTWGFIAVSKGPA